MAEFTSISNIQLAWKRTLTTQDAYYRNLQRLELNAFAWAEEENLRQLQKELSSNIFTPSETMKVYKPKPSGLVRPITVLCIRDTIVYQAIANLIAMRARSRFSKYYFKNTFSNILRKGDYQYFFMDWKFCYGKLNSARQQAFREGYVWVGELDLASFYDVINHGQLREILSKYYNNTDVLNMLFNCLTKWTIYPGGLPHSHGIPQGPLPSSFMAECTLHLLDNRMDGLKESVYLRYVDDIIIMSKNEKDARKQLARIDIACRELGLVPQIKRPLQQVTGIESLIIDEPSPIQSSSDFPPLTTRKQNDAVRKKFLSCFNKGNLKKEESQLVTKLRYSLFRMNPDRRILRKVLDLIITMPCVNDATNVYLRRFGSDAYISSFLLDYLEGNPVFSLVSASCLETVHICSVRGQYTRLRKLCVSFLSSEHHIILRGAAASTLGNRQICAQNLSRVLTNENDTYLTGILLMALSNSLPRIEKQKLLNRYVRVNNENIALIAASLLTSENLKLEGNLGELNPWATPILLKYGLTKKRSMGDRIGDILKSRYQIVLPPTFSFRKAFSRGQYSNALIHLIEAEGCFVTQRDVWVTQMDNFNQIVLVIIFAKLSINVPKKAVFGALDQTILRSQFPNIASAFTRCHGTRCDSKVSHAFSHRKGTYTSGLKPRARETLRAALKMAYQEFVDKIQLV